MGIDRRTFLAGGAALLTGAAVSAGCAGLRRTRSENIIMTVGGAIAPRKLGQALTHEHVLVDFIGAEQVNRSRYQSDEVFAVALPHLRRVRELGCESLFECTPAYIGRDPVLLRRLSEATGLNLITNTGYYGAGQSKYLPAHARSETADALAARWIREWHDGIEGSGIRPGFIKIGVDGGTLSELHQKLVQAAARTHRATGLTIAAHTGNGAAALEELQTLREEGVAASVFVWVHAQSESNRRMHIEAAQLGAWVELDGIGPRSVTQHIELVSNLRDHGLLDRVLVSHDAGWYHVGEPGGGNYRGYETVFTEFVPALRRAGFTATDVNQLLVENPAAAFTIRTRPL